MNIFEIIHSSRNMENAKITKVRIPKWISYEDSRIPSSYLNFSREKFLKITDYINNSEVRVLFYESKIHSKSWYLSVSYLRNGNPEEILMCGEKGCNRILCPTIDWFTEVK